MSSVLKNLIDLFHHEYGKDLSVYDDSFLLRSLEKCMENSGKNSFLKYFEFLKKNRHEAELFHESLNISYSDFFRNSLTFACLEKMIIPELFNRNKNSTEKVLRVWSAACSSGQEPYSVSILFKEFLDTMMSPINFRIFATDISSTQLKIAQEGIYNAESVGSVSLSRIKNNFIQSGNSFKIKKDLKDKIDYSQFDLLNGNLQCPATSVFGDFDIIIVSNLFYYYTSEVRKRILKKVESCLSKGGYLITSESERDFVKSNNYREIFTNSGIFMKSHLKITEKNEN